MIRTFNKTGYQDWTDERTYTFYRHYAWPDHDHHDAGPLPRFPSLSGTFTPQHGNHNGHLILYTLDYTLLRPNLCISERKCRFSCRTATYKKRIEPVPFEKRGLAYSLRCADHQFPVYVWLEISHICFRSVMGHRIWDDIIQLHRKVILFTPFPFNGAISESLYLTWMVAV